ncbi:MAG: hypothetical protein PF637_14340 [Spirochaetes bacterium]|jgi:hypothetical protein|nr:hypothetical protein [Spirochaetota bacterium]
MKFFIMNFLLIFVGSYFFITGIKNIRNSESELHGVLVALGIAFIPAGAFLFIAGVVNLFFYFFK